MLFPKDSQPPASDEMHKLWYWLEAHAELILPLAGLALLALIVFVLRRRIPPT